MPVSTPQKKPAGKASAISIFFFAAALAAGGGMFYWSTTDSAPAWLTRIIPSGTGQPAPPAQPAAPVQPQQTPQAALQPTLNKDPMLTLPSRQEQPDTAAPRNATAPQLASPSEAEKKPGFIPGVSANGTLGALPDAAQNATSSATPESVEADSAAVPVLQEQKALQSAPPASNPNPAPSQAPEHAPAKAPAAVDTPAQRHAEPAPSPKKFSQEPQSGAAAPEVTHSRAKPVTPQGNVVQGEIPERIVPIDAAQLYGPREARSDHGRQRISPKGQDSVVGLAFVDDFAEFLAGNYWPAGTHPLARQRGISTASVKWANLKYGGQLHGLSDGRADLFREREKILNYVFMPSMINGLYSLYKERFFNSLEYDALEQVRGLEQKPLSNAEMAEMYELYATKARSIAGIIQAYKNTPDIQQLISAYADTSTEATQAYMLFLEAMHGNTSSKADLAKKYQIAVMRREQAKENLAAAIRRGGSTQGMDPESLVYTTLWLYRRGEGKEAAQTALMNMLTNCANRLDEERARYRALPPHRAANSSRSESPSAAQREPSGNSQSGAQSNTQSNK